MYARFFKRLFDAVLALAALLVLSPLLLLLILAGAIAFRGKPFFLQPRPGRGEKVFYMLKFRSMTDKRDAAGKLLPDGERLTRYGEFLRATSLDELPELINILKGDMSIVGPRPLLVRDMVFMSEEIRRRHTVRPGLTGLAQANGRNAMRWEDRFVYDLRYVSRITLWGDIKIIFKTVLVVLRREGISEEGMATTADYGDYLLWRGDIDAATYGQKQKEAIDILEKRRHAKPKKMREQRG